MGTWTPTLIIVALIMVVTGTANTMFAKWADKMHQFGRDQQTKEYCDAHPPANKTAGCYERPFEHSFFQACVMFIGEFFCLLVYKALYLTSWKYERDNPEVVGNQNFNPLILYPAAICDMVATSVMYVGLTLTFASSFQMLRGAVMIFTAIGSVCFLKMRLYAFHWIGMVIVVAGLALVGVNDVISATSGGLPEGETLGKIILGDALIIGAQAITAIQMVYEQSVLKGRNLNALQVVGWEGIFGFITLAVLIVPMYFIHVGTTISSLPEGRLEDAIDAFVQIAKGPGLLAPLGGTLVSIAFFNFAGVTISKSINSTTRMVLDSLRTLIIWVLTLILSWQKFGWLQVPGFILLIVGMCIYNEIIFGPLLRERAGITFLTSPPPDSPPGFDEIDDRRRKR